MATLCQKLFSMLELPQYPQHIFLVVLNTKILQYLSSLVKDSFIQIVVISSFVVISNGGIKMADCINM